MSTTISKPIALNINFDSIRECLKLAGISVDYQFLDVSFFKLADRFFEVAAQYGAKYTIFVIGRDLLHKEHFRRVRAWAEDGHEIANHSYSHYQHFSHLNEKTMYHEIKLAHDIIGECTGQPPKGFVSPAWSYSPKQLEILKLLNYAYDSSLFPSFFMPLLQFQVRWASKLNQKDIPLIRKDFVGSWIGSDQPFYASLKSPWRNASKKEGLMMLPVPLTYFRIPLWHSMHFAFPDKIYYLMLKRAWNQSQGFYYVMHPLDLICPTSDLEQLPSQVRKLVRIQVPLEIKYRYLRNALDIISKESQFVTMHELAIQNMENL